MPNISLAFLLLLGLWSHFSQAATWENFVDLSLKKSPQVQQVRYQYQVPDLDYFKALQKLDWEATLESGTQRDRRESVTDQSFRLTDSLTTSAEISKSFVTGTDLSLTAITEDLRLRSASYAGTHKLRSDSYFLTVEQNFWRNAFGSAIRSEVEAARQQAEIQNLQRKETIETTILNGGQLFWKAATAQRRLEESVAELKRYEGMMKKVEQKARARYTTPGEYAQVQAQYFARQQQERSNRIEFEQAVSDLKVYLPGITENDLKWNLDDPKYQTVVSAQKLEVEGTRSHQLADLKKRQQNATAESVESANRSQLALVGQFGATGIDTNASAADREWLEGRRPSVYVGVKWSQTFGSGARDALVRSAKAQALAQDIATQTDQQKLKIQAELLAQDIYSLEENLISQNNQLQALRRGAQELTRSYGEGRIDISVLINLINQLEAAESSNIEARANLELKYLEWQFLFDRITVE